MGKTLRRVTDTVGITTPKIQGIGEIQIDRTPFDVSAQANAASKDIAALRAHGQQNVDAVNPAQTAVLQQMGQAAMGQGPSLAEEQLKQASERSLAQQIAASQATRRSQNPATMRQIAQNKASADQVIAQQAVQERLKERDAFLNAANTAQSNQLNLIQNQLEADTLNQRSLQDYEKTRSGAAATVAGMNMQNQNAAISRTGGLIQGAMQALSDRNVKKDIKPEGKSVDKFLEALKAQSYNYKDPTQPGASSGKKTGIMAQDLEKSEMGKQIVKDTPNGKAVDIAGATSAVLAAQARLNERLTKLEKKGKK